MVSGIEERVHEDVGMDWERWHVDRTGPVYVSTIFDFFRGWDGVGCI